MKEEALEELLDDSGEKFFRVDPKKVPEKYFGSLIYGNQCFFFESEEELKQYTPQYPVVEIPPADILDLNNITSDQIEKLRALILPEKIEPVASLEAPKKWYQKLFNV